MENFSIVKKEFQKAEFSQVRRLETIGARYFLVSTQGIDKEADSYVVVNLERDLPITDQKEVNFIIYEVKFKLHYF